MNDDYNDILKKIQLLCSKRGWTTYKLAKESEVSYSSITNMFARNTQPTIYTLEKLCKGLDITMSDFFKTDEKSSDFTYILDSYELELVNNFRTLKTEHKRMFMAYMRGLVRHPLDLEKLPGAEEAKEESTTNNGND